jgi:hypothetical protein
LANSLLQKFRRLICEREKQNKRTNFLYFHLSLIVWNSKIKVDRSKGKHFLLLKFISKSKFLLTFAFLFSIKPSYPIDKLSGLPIVVFTPWFWNKRWVLNTQRAEHLKPMKIKRDIYMKHSFKGRYLRWFLIRHVFYL